VSIVDSTKPGTIAQGVGAAVSEGESPQITALVERAKSGEADAFDDLMRLYERRIISVGVQMGLSSDAALDACQDTFVKVFRYIHRFRSGELFFKWLYRIAVNSIYDHLRQRRPTGVVSIQEVPGEHFPEGQGRRSLQARVEDSDLAARALGEIENLSRQEKIVFVLRDLQEMPTQQICQILGLSQVTVRRHCMSARHKLRDRLLGRKH